MLAVDEEESKVIQVLDQNVILFQHRKTEQQKQYAFDTVFDENATQIEVFEKTSKSLISHVLNGYNATTFAYGATGCGKTHTITGTENDPGIIYQSILELYQQVERKSESTEVEIAMSFLEVYNESVRDLFTKKNDLDIREDDSRVVVAGLTEVIPRDLKHVMKLLIQGMSNEALFKA